ncbi:RNA polymerase sigma-70 factor (ECF subfamily) [Novosphingobium hassiacum]|uniref:RNA polymerase sigma-70 factor (ECF subfamily) n=1 Tax=Novosphingobium hassiacum TaxID=173676 RepID=A0A7W5ZVU0_9SPHN|nr:RNA polymerase sigma factor [Novosphingobium hassiacum]MBB3858825.1 RNA polymerase sigma-70 factor (ECF subfamily) [Novosphingobium hassiacum]
MSTEPSLAGLEAVFLENREKLLRFLRSRGAGDAAEDLVQEIWLRISAAAPGPISSPLSYLFRTADMLMIDRYRSVRQAEKRDRDWSELHAAGDGEASDQPSAERHLVARQDAAQVMAALESLGPRVAGVFRRHRVDGVPQRQIAEEFGISLSTLESDMRTAYRALREWKERRDEA